jgi:hypothetical protein
LSVPEFKSADQARFEDWEKVHNRRFSDVLRLLDVAMLQAREGSPEGWGFRVEACIDGFEVKVETMPPQRSGGFGGKAASASSFSREKVQAVVMENPDLLSLKEEGGKVMVSTKKYLDKEWEAVNGRLREAGMRYVRENRRWEQA